jgi:hypothetical protein
VKRRPWSGGASRQSLLSSPFFQDGFAPVGGSLSLVADGFSRVVALFLAVFFFCWVLEAGLGVVDNSSSGSEFHHCARFSVSSTERLFAYHANVVHTASCSVSSSCHMNHLLRTSSHCCCVGMLPTRYPWRLILPSSGIARGSMYDCAPRPLESSMGSHVSIRCKSLRCTCPPSSNTLKRCRLANPVQKCTPSSSALY